MGGHDRGDLGGDGGAKGRQLAALELVTGELEARLLKIVLHELERDLGSRHGRARSIYSHGNRNFWAAKRADFRRVATTALARYRDAPARIVWIAQYFRNGLAELRTGADILIDAYKG